MDGNPVAVEASAYPLKYRPESIVTFLKYPVKPLTVRAVRGFLKRASTGTLRWPDGFLERLSAYADRMDATGNSNR
jgi:DNA (cytosine-5)-methyltransferase 1